MAFVVDGKVHLLLKSKVVQDINQASRETAVRGVSMCVEITKHQHSRGGSGVLVAQIVYQESQS